MAYRRYHNVNTASYASFNTYGSRMQISDGRVIPNFMRRLSVEKSLTVYGDGSQTRSFCHVSDEVDGILRLSRSTKRCPSTSATLLNLPFWNAHNECSKSQVRPAGSHTNHCPKMIPSNAVQISRKRELY